MADADSDMVNVPLTSAPDDAEVRPSRTLGPTNPDETYARYERSPFRKYSLQPPRGNQDQGVNRQKSKGSLMDRFNSVRFKMGSQTQRGKKNQGKEKETGRPRKEHTLYGPHPGEDSDRSYDSDEGYGDYGRRPKPQIGLAKPFPRQKRGGRFKRGRKPKKDERSGVEPGSDSGHAEGQVG